MELMFLTSTAITFTYLLFARQKTISAIQLFLNYPARVTALSMFGVVGGSTLFYTGLQSLDVGVAGVLEKLQPIFVIGLSAFFLKEFLPLKKLPWAFLALIASYFVAVKEPFQPWNHRSTLFGMLLALSASFLYSLASILGRYIMRQGASAIDLTFLRFALAAMVYVPLVTITHGWGGILHLEFRTLAALIIAAVVCTGGGYVLYYHGLKKISATKATMLELSSSIAAVIIGILFLGESPTAVQLLAAVTLLGAIKQILALS